jgi:glycosyltransferase involved in cell wall biosynthesis
VVLEAMSMEIPVVSYVDEDVIAKMYPWHPITVARRPGEIADAFTTLADDPDERRRRGLQGREWVTEFHSYSATAGAYVRAVERVLRERTAWRPASSLRHEAGHGA